MSTILVIDDDRNLRLAVGLALAQAKHEVLEAETANDGIRQARQHRPDLVLCDIYLGDGSGLDVLAKLRQSPATATTRLILVTASDESWLLRRGMDQGADDFLRKPFTAEALLAAVEAQLQKQSLYRAKAERANRQLLELIEATGDMVVIVDPQTLEIRSLNRAARHLTGLNPDSHQRPVRLAALYAPATFAGLERDALPSALSQGGWRGETDMLNRAGGTLHVLQEMLVHRTADGTIEWLSIIARDITERQRAEQALRESENRFGAIARAAFDAIIMMGPDGLISFWNAAATRIFGYTEVEAVGQSLHTLLAPGQFHAAYTSALSHFRSTGEGNAIGESLQLSALRKDGTEFPGELSLSGVWLEGHWHAVGIVRDVTRQKETTQTLRREQILLRTLIDALPDSIYAKDREARKTLANPTDVRCLGATTEKEVLGKMDHELLDSKTAAACYADDMNVITRGEAVVNRQEQVINAKGQQRWLETTKLPLRDDQGRIIGLVGIGHDITARRQAERELRQLSLAVQQSPASVVITDTAGNIEYVNPKFCALTGYTPAEVIGQNPRVLKSGEIPAEGYQELWRQVKSGREWRGEFHNRKKNGELYWESAVIAPIKDEAGKITHYLAVKEDITERKQAQEEVARERAKLKIIFESVPVGISFALPQEDRTFLTNPAHAVITGLSATDMRDKDAFDRVTHPDDLARQRVLTRRYKQGEIDHFTLEKRYLHPGGKIVWALLTRRRYTDPKTGAKQSISTVVDITERKAAEVRLAELHRQLLDTSRQAGMAEVATSVLHNVGNVLNSVNVSATLVSDRLRQKRTAGFAKVAALVREQSHDLPGFFTRDARAAQLPVYLEQFAQHLTSEREAMLSEVETLRKNIDHIKDIVAMQQSYAKVSGVTECVQPAELFEDTLSMNAGALTRHGIEVIKEFVEVPAIEVEKHKVLQILINFLRNAKYACTDSGRPDKRIVLGVVRCEDRVRFSVIDNGVGIPSENLPRIFNHGFTTKKDGHGFGLHSGANAAREMGGTVAVHSDGPGLGATFTLELPLAPPRSPGPDPMPPVPSADPTTHLPQG